jgi:hypothetical protein
MRPRTAGGDGSLKIVIIALSYRVLFLISKLVNDFL